MQKEEKSSRYAVMCYLMAIMGIDVDEATHLVAEMEKKSWFNLTNWGMLDFYCWRDNHETYYRKSLSNIRALL